MYRSGGLYKGAGEVTVSSKRFKLMHKPAGFLPDTQIQSCLPQGSVLFLFVHCLGPLFVFSCQNDFSEAASTTLCDLVYLPEE